MTLKQIAFLLMIKTASILQKSKISISLNKTSISLLRLLYKHGIIQNFLNLNTSIINNRPYFLVFLRYFFNKPIFQNLKFFSKPSLYLTLSFSNLCLLQDKRHILFLSTTQGILTNFECKIKKIGGIVLFKC